MFSPGCVLFVQHPSKNALSGTVPSGSFVACAGVFSNCDVATEGGIPRSSRYTNGATRYNIQDLAASAGANTIYSGTGLAGAYQSVGFGIAPDTVFSAGFQQQLVQTWGMRGGFTHNWDPYWNSSIYGAWAAVSYNDTAKGLLCGIGGVGGSFRATTGLAGIGGAAAVCNPDYNIGQIGFVTRWTPVKNLTFTGDVTFTHLDQKMLGTVNAASATIGKPSTVYELKDQNTVLLLLRAQRNW
jgi:hypothetical protein